MLLHFFIKLPLLGNELIYVGKKNDVRRKVVTELTEIQEILHQYHSNPMGGHSGINNTLSKCDRCQRYDKLKAQAPQLKSIKVDKAMELVGMDLIG